MTSTSFLVLTGLAVLLALVFALVPLIRRKSGEVPVAVIVALVVFLPAATFGIYRVVGTPEGLDPPQGQMDQVAETLRIMANRVNRHPADIEAWATMGMIWKDLQLFPAAEAGFRRVLFHDPDNVFAMTELAETLLYASGRPQMPAEGRQLLAEALRQDPDYQKALWLSGLAAFQEGQFAASLHLWERLRAQLPEGPVREQINQQIARVRMHITEPDFEGLAQARNPHAVEPEPAPEAAAPSPGPANNGAIAASVQISPKLSGRLQGSEMVYVFARAAGGPAMPLAVRRLRSGELPAEVRLTDGDAMVEGTDLSSFERLEIVARVSFAGDVMARPGDLEGTTGPFDPAEAGSLNLVIDRVIE